MKRLRSIPYILLGFSIFVSTVIAMVQNMSFTLFCKRTTIFFLVTFISSKMCINSIIKTKEFQINPSEMNIVIPYDKVELETDTKQTEDDFALLDVDQLKTKTNSKVVEKIN
ncbi:hypothetical protein QBE52_09320 [Clostridiaceae bacterium 35-E11]